MFDVQLELSKLPHEPGVYIMHDTDDTVIYVGKAKDLHNRVRSYFRKIVGRGPQIDKMVSLIDYFEYIVTDSEIEALVLENNLIKEYSPKYNTMLKDDKTYPYIKVTLGEEYPRVLLSRQMKKDKSKYFGPYPSAGAVKDTIELVNKVFRLRTCAYQLPLDSRNKRACLNYHIDQCCGPCQNYVTVQEYRDRVNAAVNFLNGEYEETLSELKDKMMKLSDEMKYEDAAKIRDLYNSVLSISQRQKITAYDEEDKDIIALATKDKDAVVQVFFVRYGKLIGREHYYMTHVSENASNPESRREILMSFINQFYSGTPFVPKQIMTSEDICDNEEIQTLEQFLSHKRGNKVHIVIPKIGTKEKLVELAAKNAELILSKDSERIKREEAKTIGAVHEIEQLLNISSIRRMEAFDISNISGFMNVGSMVVFENGKPKKSDYRKFRMKNVEGPDDYACMKEVLTRRFLHGLNEKQELREQSIDAEFGSFTKFPDLLMMDGGRGQVNVAMQVLNELGLHIPVCGMVKDDNHNTRGLYFNNKEVMIDTRSEGFKLITRIQDEAHRFAIEYHRLLRSKSATHSILDDIPGVGAVRRKALMRAFKSIDELKEASVDELSLIDEIPYEVAENIYAFFHNETDK